MPYASMTRPSACVQEATADGIVSKRSIKYLAAVLSGAAHGALRPLRFALQRYMWNRQI